MSLLLRVRAEWFCFVRFSDFPCPRWRPPLNFLLSHHLALGLFYLDLLLKEVDLMLLLNQLLLLLSDLAKGDGSMDLRLQDPTPHKPSRHHPHPDFRASANQGGQLDRPKSRRANPFLRD